MMCESGSKLGRYRGNRMENKIFNIIIKNKQEFKSWILKNYFSDNTREWFDPKINENNVLDFVSESKNFPQTPNNLVHLWKLKEGFKKFSSAKEKLEEEKEMKYTVGDETLKNIGKEIGDVTPTMVTKFYASAINKIKFATGGKSIEQMDSEELDNLNIKIMMARSDAAKDYAGIMIKNQGKISNIIKELVSNHFITKNEAELVTEDEVIEIIKLSNKPKEEICLTLYTDIERDNNMFKTYQSIVSKKFYKNRKFI